MIVFGQEESHLFRTTHEIVARDFLPVLENSRTLLPNPSDQQITVCVGPNRPIIRKLNRTRVRAGTNDEVVFQSALCIVVIDDIDARINIPVANASIVRHARAPLAVIIA